MGERAFCDQGSIFQGFCRAGRRHGCVDADVFAAIRTERRKVLALGGDSPTET